MTTATTIRNGIDVDQLVNTIDAIKANHRLGEFTFKATSTWQNGTHSKGEIGRFVHAGNEDTTRTRPFALEGDEPPVLLGENAGPNAVELLLQALAFCYSVGYVANAAALGITISSMDYTIEGDLDVRPFLGIDGPRAGFTEIRAHARVSSPNATKEQLEDLCRYVQETSPVRDTLVNATAVVTTLEVMG